MSNIAHTSVNFEVVKAIRFFVLLNKQAVGTLLHSSIYQFYFQWWKRKCSNCY